MTEHPGANVPWHLAMSLNLAAHVTVCSRWGILSTNHRTLVFCAIPSGQCAWTMTQWVLFSPRENCSHSQCLWRGEPMASQEQRAPGTIGLVASWMSPLPVSTVPKHSWGRSFISPVSCLRTTLAVGRSSLPTGLGYPFRRSLHCNI